MVIAASLYRRRWRGRRRAPARGWGAVGMRRRCAGCLMRCRRLCAAITSMHRLSCRAQHTRPCFQNGTDACSAYDGDRKRLSEGGRSGRCRRPRRGAPRGDRCGCRVRHRSTPSERQRQGSRREEHGACPGSGSAFHNTACQIGADCSAEEPGLKRLTESHLRRLLIDGAVRQTSFSRDRHQAALF